MRFFQDDHLIYIRKPAGIASTRGKQDSLLDFLVRGKQLEAEIPAFVLAHIHEAGIKEIADTTQLREQLLARFDREQELGLLNRLDTVTSGLLYFAPSTETYTAFRGWQEEQKVEKYYLARVQGDVGYLLTHKKELPFVAYTDEYIHFSYPLIHHKHQEDRMVALIDPWLREDTWSRKGRWSRQESTSVCKVLSYDDGSKQSLLEIMIHQGQRHQIRAHLAAAGYPILGESLYAKKIAWERLQLWSVGAKIN